MLMLQSSFTGHYYGLFFKGPGYLERCNQAALTDCEIASVVVAVGTTGTPLHHHPTPPLLFTPLRPGSIFGEQDCGNGMINGLGEA